MVSQPVAALHRCALSYLLLSPSCCTNHMPYARPSAMHHSNDTRFSSAEPSPSGSSTQVSHLRVPDPPWQHHLSATFSQLSEQLRDASQTLSAVPLPSEDVAASLLERLGYIEERQRNLEAEIRELREHFSEPREPPVTGVEALLKEHLELYKLDQERLPGRLHNSLATKSLSPVKMLPMKNRKFPPNSPGTRGEFEHLTKERYEAIMTCYDIPLSGDTAAKRESVRAFLGIPSTPLERK